MERERFDFLIQSQITGERKSAEKIITKAQEFLRYLDDPAVTEALTTISALPAIADVEAIQMWFLTSCDGDLFLRLTLAKPDSALVRELVKALGVKAEKRPSGGALEAELKLPGLQIEVTGYRPATCRIEYEDVMVPARLERRAKVVCTPEEDEAPAPAPQEEAVEDEAPMTAIVIAAGSSCVQGTEPADDSGYGG